MRLQKRFLKYLHDGDHPEVFYLLPPSILGALITLQMPQDCSTLSQNTGCDGQAPKRVFALNAAYKVIFKSKYVTRIFLNALAKLINYKV